MSFGDQKDINSFKKGMDRFMRDPSLASAVTNNNDIVVGENRTVFQQLDAGKPVSRSVSHIQVGSFLSSKKSVTNGAEAASSLSAGKQEVAAKAAEMKDSWDANKADAIACLREAADNKGFAVASQISMGSVNDSGLGSLVTSNNSGSDFLGFEISKQDKKLDPEELKALIADTVMIAQSGGAEDTRVSSSFDEIAPKSDIAKLDEVGMEQLLTQDITDQPEYKEALDLGYALDEVSKNHMYVARNYNPTDVAENKYDSVDVDLAGQALQGIVAIKMGSDAAAANEAHFGADISDVSSKLARSGLVDDVPVYNPPQPSIDKVLGIG